MDSSPTPSGPPAEITHLVRERTEARARRDWARADVLKAQIEAAGWRLVDHGSRTSVSPAAPATVEIQGEVRYGSPAAVPSLLESPATGVWTVVVAASEQPAQLSRLLGALRTHAPTGIQIVAVANDPNDAQAAALAAGAPDCAPIGGLRPEVLRTSTRLGYAAALNLGLRRASGEFVLLVDGTARPTGDALTALVAALADPQVAAAGGYGLYAEDAGPLRPNWLVRDPVGDEGAAGTRLAVALEGGWLAFRRDDCRELGPLDEHFVTPAWLDVWWTLRLRAGAEPEGSDYVASAEAAEPTDSPNEADSPGSAERAKTKSTEGVSVMPAPRRVVRVDMPLEREDVPWPPDRSRLNRRNMYRVLDRFGWRDDLT